MAGEIKKPIISETTKKEMAQFFYRTSQPRIIKKYSEEKKVS